MLFGLGVLLLLSGVLIWIGSVRQVSAVHMLQGLVLVLLLWTVAVIAARAGVSRRIVALAVAWSLVALVIAVAQEELLTGSWHWTIQVLHVVTSIGVIAWGQRLVAFTRRNGIPASSSHAKKQLTNDDCSKSHQLTLDTGNQEG